MTNLVKFGEYSVDQAEQEKQEISRGEYMKLKVGKNVVRFLPPRIGQKSPFAIVSQHYITLPGQQRATVFACPRVSLNKLCPACVRADELSKTGSAADRNAASGLWPSKRVMANAIDRGDQDKGPQILTFGKTIHETLTAIRTDQVAGGDFTHPLDGFDVMIQREGTGKEDTKYRVIPARHSTPLHPDPATMQSWIDEAHDLSIRVASAEEIMAMLSGGAPARGSGPPEGGAPARQSRASSGVQDSVDADFSEKW